MLTASQEKIFRQGWERLAGACELDHSISVAQLGSLFTWHGDKPLQRLKRQLADAYDVAWSFPSTQGTTTLNTLALLSACPAGGRVLVNRDAHTSVTAAMVQGGLEPVYLVPEYDSDLGLSLGPTLAGFTEVLGREPVDCVFLTSPNYFGIVGELAEIISLAHERGLPVVVDAAHAPHFHFCKSLPTGAEDMGADLVTQSTHKVASALSQGSLLLVGNEQFIESLYEQVNELGLVSTSFSYPILASIELGVGQLVEEGETLWSETIESAAAFREASRGLLGVTCFGHDQVRPGFVDFDSTRITLDVSGTGLTGFDFERRLHREKIYPEMASLQHVLFLLTPGTTEEDLHALFRALRGIADGSPHKQRVVAPPPPALPEIAVAPRVGKFSTKQPVPIKDAVGKISGESVATYPPGAPIIAPGEIVSLEVIEYLQCMKASGAVLKGAADPSLQTFKVLN